MRYWLFQAKPDYAGQDGDLRKALGAAPKRWSWGVRRYRDEIRRGDVVFIWQSGESAGIYGLANVISNPGERIPADDPVGSSDYEGPCVDLRVIETYLDAPLLRTDIKLLPGLENLSIMRFWQGTNFPVTDSEARSLLKILEIAPPAGSNPVSSRSRKKGSRRLNARRIVRGDTTPWGQKTREPTDLAERARLRTIRSEKSNAAHQRALWDASEWLTKFRFDTFESDYDILAKRKDLWLLIEVKSINSTSIRIQTMKAIGQLAYYALSIDPPRAAKPLCRLVLYDRVPGDDVALRVLQAEEIQPAWVDGDEVRFLAPSFKSKLTRVPSAASHSPNRAKQR